MGSPSSSAQNARQALGNRLREIRTDAGLTGRDLATRAGWQSSKVSKIEFGRQNATPDDIRTWCHHCGARSQEGDLLASLRAVDDMFVEWHRMERSGLRQAQESVVPLWERTRSFRIYSSWVIPGPLQRAAYIRAILSDIRRRRNTIDDVDAAVQVRVDKQHVTHEGDHRFAIVLEESVLRYAIGGPEVMAAQLGHLLSVGALPAVSLGIIPLSADRSQMWPVEPFWMFDDGLARVELISGHLSITVPRACFIRVGRAEARSRRRSGKPGGRSHTGVVCGLSSGAAVRRLGPPQAGHALMKHALVSLRCTPTRSPSHLTRPSGARRPGVSSTLP